MPDERLTKNQKREAAREAARVARDQRLKRESRNKVLLRVGVTVAIVAVLGGGVWGGYQLFKPAGPGPDNMASDGIVLVGDASGIRAIETGGVPSDGEPTPTVPADLDRAANIVVYVDYQCPFCQLFDVTNARSIEALLATGTTSVEIHPVAILDNTSLGNQYSTRAANAMACVAQFEPDAFLDVNTALFEAQPSEGTGGMSDRELIDVIESAGVVSDEVAGCVRDGRFKAWVRAATQRALSDQSLRNAQGSFGTPTVFVNGERYLGALEDAQSFNALVAKYAFPAESS